MALSKSRLLIPGLALASLGAVALGYAAPQLGRAWLSDGSRTTAHASAPVRVAGTEASVPPVAAPAPSLDKLVRVDAPHAAVRVDKENGKVTVKAPYADVKVDPDKGQVRVRAPYVNLDIRW